MPDEEHGGGIVGFRPGQSTREVVGGWADIRIAIRNTLILGALAGVTAPLLALATLVVGPWSLVVLVPAGIEAVSRWFYVPEPDDEPDDDGSVTRANKAALGAVVLVVLAVAPEWCLSWWPWGWQVDRSTSWGLLWPPGHPGWIKALLVVRIVPVVAFAMAWPQTWHLAQRLRREIHVPTASGAAYESASLADIDIPGTYNPHRSKDAAPQVTVNPVRPVPFNAPKAALTLDVLMSPTGKQVGQGKLLRMLEAQHVDAGFGWRIWHGNGWTRGEWDAAMEILEAQGLITPRVSGQATRLIGGVDDALDAIERLI